MRWQFTLICFRRRMWRHTIKMGPTHLAGHHINLSFLLSTLWFTSEWTAEWFCREELAHCRSPPTMAAWDRRSMAGTTPVRNLVNPAPLDRDSERTTIAVIS